MRLIEVRWEEEQLETQQPADQDSIVYRFRQKEDEFKDEGGLTDDLKEVEEDAADTSVSIRSPKAALRAVLNSETAETMASKYGKFINSVDLESLSRKLSLRK